MCGGSDGTNGSHCAQFSHLFALRKKNYRQESACSSGELAVESSSWVQGRKSFGMETLCASLPNSPGAFKERAALPRQRRHKQRTPTRMETRNRLRAA